MRKGNQQEDSMYIGLNVRCPSLPLLSECSLPNQWDWLYGRLWDLAGRGESSTEVHYEAPCLLPDCWTTKIWTCYTTIATTTIDQATPWSCLSRKVKRNLPFRFSCWAFGHRSEQSKTSWKWEHCGFRLLITLNVHTYTGTHLCLLSFYHNKRLSTLAPHMNF